MSSGYKIRNQSGIHFLSFAVVEWVDVFTRRAYCEIIVDRLNHCIQKKGLVVYAWVIMSNHLHLIVSAKDDNLSDVLRDFKKFTAREIIKSINNDNIGSRKNWMLWLFRSAGAKNKRNKDYQFTDSNRYRLAPG
ncbi:transposase [Fulvivirga imtechensis]|nr:transposase [Fulvivirga imtechensis]